MMAASSNQTPRGELSFDEPMSRHTSWRAGGVVKQFYRPADMQDLADFLRGLPADEALLWVGLGSNLLVRDGGFDGTAISLKGCLDDCAVEAGQRLVAGAGLTCAKAARYASRNGLTGLEFFAGIPGTVGGALRMNAGAWGGETWAHVLEVTTINRSGELKRRSPDDFEVAYREVHGPRNEWFVQSVFQLQLGDVEAGQKKIRALLEQRGATQPTNQPSCGSVFRNPESDYAARLIEHSGMKGRCVGGACVSEKHANFIINTGTASATDIESLLQSMRKAVHEQTGVLLQPEVHIVGDAE